MTFLDLKSQVKFLNAILVRNIKLVWLKMKDRHLLGITPINSF